MKHIFINITVQDGEYQHTHKVLHTTNDAGLCGKVTHWTDIPEKDYKILRLYI